MDLQEQVDVFPVRRGVGRLGKELFIMSQGGGEGGVPCSPVAD